MDGRFRVGRSGVLALSVAWAVVAPATLQAAPPAAPAAETMVCDSSKVKLFGSMLLGNRFDTVADSKLGRLGISGLDKLARIAGSVSDSIGRRLNRDEQRQAQAATTIAVCRGKPGETVKWVSANNAGVSGSSTVARRDELTDGSTCIMVRDVALVAGEEVKVTRRLCRKPGETGYKAVS
jgi:surface antigen